MPTYEYVCDACKHGWELFQSMTAKPEKTCPACGKKSARRLIGTGAAVMFKGSGFYQTDYRSASYKQGAEAEKKAADGGKPAGANAESAKPAEAAPKPAAAAPAAPAPATAQAPGKKSKAGRNAT